MDLTGKVAASLRRVSSRGQDEDNQEAPIHGYVLSRNMTRGPDYPLKASASKGKHAPVIARIIADAKAGLFQVLVIRAVDRLDRRGALYAWPIIADLMDAGVPVLSVAEPELERIREDPMAEAIIGVKIAIARQEILQLRRRIRDGHDRIDAAGKFRGSPPAGYSVQGPEYARYLEPDFAQDEDRPVRRRRIQAADVTQAITDASTGTSTLKLGARLGVTADGMAMIIRNLVYSTGRYEVRSACRTCPACERGDACTTPRVLVHRCSPLIDKPEVQQLAIASLGIRRKGDNVSSRAIRKQDYSGALFCPVCGGTLYRYNGGSKKRPNGTVSAKVRRYACTAKNENGKRCSKSVRADDADAAVNELMASRQYPWMRSRLIEGNDHSAQLRRLEGERDTLGSRGLPLEKMLAEATRLYAEIEQMKSLPIIPPRTVIEIARREDGTVITEADHWRGLTPGERRAYLLHKARAQDAERVIVTPAPGRTGRVIAEIEEHNTGVEHGSEAA